MKNLRNNYNKRGNIVTTLTIATAGLLALISLDNGSYNSLYAQAFSLSDLKIPGLASQ